MECNVCIDFAQHCWYNQIVKFSTGLLKSCGTERKTHLKNMKEHTYLIEFDYTIQEAVGIHARPAGLLVKEVKKYKSTVTVIKGDKSSNALKLMALMGMGVKCGDTVTVTVEGEDEDTAAPALEAFFKEHL